MPYSKGDPQHDQKNKYDYNNVADDICGLKGCQENGLYCIQCERLAFESGQ